MTHIHGDDVAPQLVLIVLPNGEGNETPGAYFQTLTLVEPLDAVRVW